MSATMNEMEKRRLPGASIIPGLRSWTWVIFFVVLIAEIIGAYVLMYERGYIFNDASARTANAFFVLFITPPKLASIGFVWNPLPSLLQIPILYFKDWWPPLASSGMGGSILTSLFAAINASLLFRYFRTEVGSTWFSILIAALYAFNPFIFLYGCNGMSETIFFTSLIVGIHNFVLWMDDRATNRLLAIALMLAMAFLTRYETFAWMLAIALSLVVVVYLMEDRQSPFKNKPSKMKFDYLVATGALVFVPVMYTIFIWIFLCLTIMGDPLYFLRSAYSNTSQSLAAIYVQENVGRYYKVFIDTIIKSIPFLAPAVVLFIERTATKRLFKPDTLVYILFAGGFIGFHYTLLIQGRSFGWLRFFSYILPITVAWFPYELARLKKLSKTLTALGLVISLAVVSPLLLLHYYKYRNLAYEEYDAFHKSPAIVCQREMAEKINQKYSDATILFDGFLTTTLIINLDHPENVRINTSDDFDKMVKNPMGYDVDYILTTVNEEVGVLDAINREYPDIFEHGAPWAELVEEVLFEGNASYFRLYRVIPW